MTAVGAKRPVPYDARLQPHLEAYLRRQPQDMLIEILAQWSSAIHFSPGAVDNALWRANLNVLTRAAHAAEEAFLTTLDPLSLVRSMRDEAWAAAEAARRARDDAWCLRKDWWRDLAEVSDGR